MNRHHVTCSRAGEPEGLTSDCAGNSRVLPCEGACTQRNDRARSVNSSTSEGGSECTRLAINGRSHPDEEGGRTER